LKNAYDKIAHLSIEVFVDDADVYDSTFKSYLPANLESLSLKFEVTFKMKIVDLHKALAAIVSESKIKTLKLCQINFFTSDIEYVWT
jgi:hypothetical protein